MAIDIEETDMGLTGLFEDLAKADKLEVHVGWQGSKGSAPHGDSGLSVGQVAMLQEFGTSNIPARPALRTALQHSEGKVSRATSGAMKPIALGKRTPEQALSIIGRAMVQIVKQRISSSRSWAAPNAPSTVAQKGFNYPLIESGLVLNSVTYQVRRGRTVVAEGS